MFIKGFYFVVAASKTECIVVMHTCIISVNDIYMHVEQYFVDDTQPSPQDLRQWQMYVSECLTYQQITMVDWRYPIGWDLVLYQHSKNMGSFCLWTCLATNQIFPIFH